MVNGNLWFQGIWSHQLGEGEMEGGQRRQSDGHLQKRRWNSNRGLN